MVKVITSKFLKAEDVTEGGMIAEFVNEGEYRESKWGKKLNIRIKYGEEEKIWTMNDTSVNSVAEVYGKDSVEWVGAQVKLELIKQNVGGEIKDVVYGTPTGPTKEIFSDKEQKNVDEGKGWDGDE